MKKFTLEKNGARIDVYETKEPPKAAVVICPGGGYENLSDREGEPVAKQFLQDGYMAIVLWYEVKKQPMLGNLPLQQLSDTVSWLRDHAQEYRMEKKHIYVCGFSAGGHLAGSLGILWNRKEYFTENTDLKKHRPDGMILAYPVITSGEFAHRSSLVRLAGDDPAKQEVYSLEKWVDEDCVPVYLWGTFADDAVPVENSLLLLKELAKYRIPVEYHLFPEGVHGLSLATKEVEEPEAQRDPDKHIARWMPLCLEWLDHVREKKAAVTKIFR